MNGKPDQDTLTLVILKPNCCFPMSWTRITGASVRLLLPSLRNRHH